jgi:uncharacterized protein YkwD
MHSARTWCSGLVALVSTTAVAPALSPSHARAAAPSFPASLAACEEVRWDLDDTLRELVELRVARGRPIAPTDVQLALRRRGLTVVDPVFRFEPRAPAPVAAPVPASAPVPAPAPVDDPDAEAARERASVDRAPRGESPLACEVARAVREGRASLRVAAPIVALDIDIDVVAATGARAGAREGARSVWRVRASFVEPVDAAASLVVAGLVGAARTHPLLVQRGRGEVSVPSAPERDAVAQIVAMTARGPEVVAERWIGDAEAIARARAEADARTPRDLVRGLAEERAALGLPPLAPNASLDRLAARTLATALARGALTHRTPEGLVDDRLQAARIAHRGAGELLARIPAGADAASRFAASPAHRGILGDPSLTHVGAATRRGPDGLDWIVVVLANLAHGPAAPGQPEPARPTRRAPRRP